jgi:cell division protein FtsB
MLWVVKHWKKLLVGLLLASMLGGAYWQGGQGARASCLKAELKASKALAKQLAKANEERDRLARELAALQNQPKASPIIREVIREFPSNCSVPSPVADSLREQIERANTSRRSTD